MKKNTPKRMTNMKNEKLASEKWESYRIPNSTKSKAEELTGYTIVDDEYGIVGVIIKATEEDIIFYGSPKYWRNSKIRKKATIKGEEYYG